MEVRQGLPNSRYQLKERCRVLAQAGWVEYEVVNGRRWYYVTSDGLGWLDGRMLAEQIYPHLTPEWQSHLRPRV
jgi:hypothetical protein